MSELDPTVDVLSSDAAPILYVEHINIAYSLGRQAHQSTDQSISQLTNQLTTQSIDQSINQSINQSAFTDQSTLIKTFYHSVLGCTPDAGKTANRDTTMWMNVSNHTQFHLPGEYVDLDKLQSINQPINQVANQPASHTINQSSNLFSLDGYIGVCLPQSVDQLIRSIEQNRSELGDEVRIDVEQSIDQSVTQSFNQSTSDQSINQSVNQSNAVLAALQHYLLVDRSKCVRLTGPNQVKFHIHETQPSSSSAIDSDHRGIAYVVVHVPHTAFDALESFWQTYFDAKTTRYSFHSNNRSINQTIDQSVKQSVEQSTSESIGQSVSQSVSQLAVQVDSTGSQQLIFQGCDSADVKPSWHFCIYISHFSQVFHRLQRDGLLFNDSRNDAKASVNQSVNQSADLDEWEAAKKANQFRALHVRDSEGGIAYSLEIEIRSTKHRHYNRKLNIQ